MLAKVSLEVFALAICDMVETDVILDGLIKQLVGLLESCLLHWEKGIIRCAAKDLDSRVVELKILYDLRLPVHCVAAIVRAVVSCIMHFLILSFWKQD